MPYKLSQGAPITRQASHAPKFGGLGSMTQKALPFTSMLNPFKLENAFYLMGLTFLTRTITGWIRIGLNHPTVMQKVLKDPERRDSLDKKEQSLAFLEMLFVETFDSLGALLTLHLGIDGLAKLFEYRNKDKLSKLPLLSLNKLKNAAKFKETLRGKGISPDDFIAHYNQALKKAYPGNKNHIWNVTYNHGSLNDIRENMLISLRKAGNLFERDSVSKAFRVIREEPVIDDFFRLLNRKSVLATSIAIVAIGTAVSGFLVQYVNDQLYSAMVKPLAAWIVKQLPKNNANQPTPNPIKRQPFEYIPAAPLMQQREPSMVFSQWPPNASQGGMQ